MPEGQMTENGYFSKRADAERGAALKAKDMPSFRAHMGMALEYERRARGFAPRQADRVVLD